MTNYLDHPPFAITKQQACLILPKIGKTSPKNLAQIEYIKMLKQLVFEHLLDVAAEFKLKHISLAFSARGAAEILGDDSRIDNWPAIWRVVDHLGKISAGCGNANQKQVWGEYFDRTHEGKWDVKTRTKIGDPLRCVTR